MLGMAFTDRLGLDLQLAFIHRLQPALRAAFRSQYEARGDDGDRY
jgi:hypothetical protein